MVGLRWISGRTKKIRFYIRERMPTVGVIRKVFIYFDVICSTALYGGSIDDYFDNRFYLLNHVGRSRFFVWRKRRRLIRVCNDQEDRKIFDDKSRFNQVFAEFVGREWLSTGDCSYEDFAAFASRHRSFFVKPVIGSFGLGASRQEAAAGRDMDGLFQSMQAEGMLVEGVIRQWPELAEFNPASVNTLRLVTLKGAEGVVKVMTAALRCGNGQGCTDNLFQGGICAAVDIATGIVTTPGADLKGRRFVLHPQSGKPIVGFKVPFWGEIVELVSAAADLVPTVRYVGWDVALTEGGRAVLVEGNSCADADLTEIPDGVGKWPLFKDEVKKIVRLKQKAYSREGERGGESQTTVF